MQNYHQQPTRIIASDVDDASTDLVSLPPAVQRQLQCAEGLMDIGLERDAMVHYRQALTVLAGSSPRDFTLLAAASMGFTSIMEEEVVTDTRTVKSKNKVLGMTYGTKNEKITDTRIVKRRYTVK